MTPRNMKRRFNIKQLAEHFNCDRKTVKAALVRDDIQPAGTDARGFASYPLAAVEAAFVKQRAGRVRLSPIKELLVAEQLRRLKLHNDLKSGILVEQSAVCDAIAKMGLRWNKVEVEALQDAPAKLAAARSDAERRKVLAEVLHGFRREFEATAKEFAR